MTTQTADVQAVGPTLPIVTTIGWIVGFFILAVPTMVSPMLFDSGGSFWTELMVVGLVTAVLSCAISAVGGWIAWALTRTHRGGAAMVFRGAVYLLPLVGIAVTVFGLAVIQFACGGALNCST